MRQDRIMTGVREELALIKAVIDMGPPELRDLPPNVAMALIHEILSINRRVEGLSEFGAILAEDLARELPELTLKESDSDGPELLES